MLDINTIEIIRKIFERWPKRFVDVLNSLNEKQQVSKRMNVSQAVLLQMRAVKTAKKISIK